MHGAFCPDIHQRRLQTDDLLWGKKHDSCIYVDEKGMYSFVMRATRAVLAVSTAG
jgi:hypothetical protein